MADDSLLQVFIIVEHGPTTGQYECVRVGQVDVLKECVCHDRDAMPTRNRSIAGH